jgi:DNA-binding NtrC family response regulator
MSANAGEERGLPLAGKSVLVIVDEALIAMDVESCLLDAGAAVVKIANSIAAAQSALNEGVPFDAAIADLSLTDENACPLVQVLSERAIPVVITTGADIDLGHPALSNAVAFLQKPYTRSDLIEALVEWAVAKPLAPPRVPANPVTRESAMGWLDAFRRRQAAYAASLEKIADAQLAIVENKLLGVSDPSRDANLLSAYQEALNHLLEIGERVNQHGPES